MQRRVLITLLGMAFASLTSACGQKSPLFLPEASDRNTSVNTTHANGHNTNNRAVVLTHAQVENPAHRVDYTL
jgi:predicted small lipoprotein YifL